ncbi:MAG: hypothetical protein Q9221_008110 [Calogaya cf. arnoldii]
MAGSAVWQQEKPLEQIDGGPLDVARGPASSTESNLQATITPAPATTQCPPCQILVSAGEGGMSRVFWWNSTLDLTLDTVSVVITQYNSTVITGITTVRGDINSLDPENITEVQDLKFSLVAQQYPGQPGIILVNDTKGLVEGGLSFPYPTSYLVAPGYDYYTQIASGFRDDDGCPAGQSLSGDSKCVCRLATVDLGRNLNLEDDEIFSKTAFRLNQTFYSTMTPDGQKFEYQLNNNIVDFNVALFSSWLASINPKPPQFESCYFPSVLVGPPALKVQVSALTATITTTVRGTDKYSWTTATPALTASHELPAATSMAATTRKNEPIVKPEPAPGMDPLGSTIASDAPKDPQTRTLASPPSEIVSSGSTYTLDPSSDYVVASKVLTEGDDDSKTDETPISIAEGDAIIVTGISNQFSPEQGLIPTPVVSMFGSIHTLDKSSNLVFEGQTMTPGGVLTVSGSVISVPIIADTVSGRSSAQTVTRTPVVSFLGSAYTMDESSNFVVEGQTITPGGVLTVSGSMVSVPTIASSQAQTLVQPPVVTFLGSTYTMDKLSMLVVEGQTVTPGGVLTVSGSVVSVPIIESSLAQTSMRTPVLSLFGSTFTMDMSSNFVLDGQTVQPGGAITVSGSAVSLPSGGLLFVVGGITKTLSQAIITAQDQDIPSTSGLVAEATGSPGEQIAGGSPTAGGTAGTSANSANTDGVSSKASASGFRPIFLVVFGLCASLGLVSTTT